MKNKKLSRRDFLQASALGISALAGSSILFSKRLEAFSKISLAKGKLPAGNTMPGKIRICTDPNISSDYNGDINKELVQNAFDQCMRALIPGRTPEQVLEYLMPNLKTNTKIVFKINLFSQCDTRWEVARALVYRLSRCLNNTYDVSNIIICDNHIPFEHGYYESEFTFNGRTPTLAGNNGGESNVFPLPDYTDTFSLGQFFVDAEYIFNLPVIKDHSQYAITGSLKNHFGSCNPPGICGSNNPYTNILYLNADSHIKPKTVLIVADMIRGVWDGGPGAAPQRWNTFENHTPNSIMVSTDPVTSDYWYRYYINRERTERGYSEQQDQYIEEASQSPWELGISDPGQMDMEGVDPNGFEEKRSAKIIPEKIQMLSNQPNPFTHQTEVRFILKEAGDVEINIFDIRGRLILKSKKKFNTGYNGFLWKPKGIHPGIYTVELKHKYFSLVRLITKL
ncbi:MAG: DUF362 domain-containing protein [Candidatus Coatesbacteria bacterium]|nr:DUF362 domain-containing protein [Candidatus Coatesbacteria bacterium]